MQEPKKKYNLRINITVSEAGGFGTGLQVSESYEVEAEGFLGACKILSAFHELAILQKGEFILKKG